MKIMLSMAFIALVFVLTGFLAYANQGGGSLPWGNPPFSGTVQGSSTKGYGRRPITVTLTLTEGHIVDVKMNLSGETPRYVRGLPEKTKTQMINTNNWDVDAVSGATKTVDGIRDAAKKALEQIPIEDNK